MDGPRFLVPTDFSSCARYALATADALAMERRAHLHILHVHAPVESAAVDFSWVQGGEDAHVAAKSLLEALRAWAGHLQTPPERLHFEVCVGHPVEEIVERSRGVDLAVLGTHGRSGMSLFLLGSVTERVVRSAHCSVYVAKEVAAKDA